MAGDETERPGPGWATIVMCVSLATLAGAVAGGRLATPDPPHHPPTVRVAGTRQRPLSSAAEHSARQATVKIEASSCSGPVAGSGVVLADGRILTNIHVLAGATGARVLDDSGVATPLATPRARLVDDLAAADPAGGGSGQPPPALPGGGAGARVAATPAGPGDEVWVAGHPQGGGISIRSGHVVTPRRGSDYGVQGGEVFLTDVGVEPGSSGSGVFNRSGEIVGVVFSRDNATGGGVFVPIERAVATGGWSEFPWVTCPEPPGEPPGVA